MEAGNDSDLDPVLKGRFYNCLKMVVIFLQTLLEWINHCEIN